TRVELNTDNGNDNAKLAIKIRIIILPLSISSTDNLFENILSILKYNKIPTSIVMSEMNENNNKNVPINFDSNSSFLSTLFLDRYRTIELPNPKSSTLK